MRFPCLSWKVRYSYCNKCLPAPLYHSAPRQSSERCCNFLMLLGAYLSCQVHYPYSRTLLPPQLYHSALRESSKPCCNFLVLLDSRLSYDENAAGAAAYAMAYNFDKVPDTVKQKLYSLIDHYQVFPIVIIVLLKILYTD
jgi:hypothetical protein